MNKRVSGILMPISAVPNEYGSGDFGSSSYQFIDKLVDAKVGLWQILPLNKTGYGDSPYQALSTNAIDEIYVSIEYLKASGFIKDSSKYYITTSTQVNYKFTRETKMVALIEAYQNINISVLDGIMEYFKDQEWAYEYALYATLKKKNALVAWTEWDIEEREFVFKKASKLYLDNIEGVRFELFVQYVLFNQYFALKNYANRHNVKIVGDIPFYLGLDSVEVWQNRKCFMLDSDNKMKNVAGVPPDYFSEDGQRWGNPLYNWDYLKETNYKFWIDRIKNCQLMYDILRIDHFRAFDSYYAINSACETAKDGEWFDGPSYDFLDKLFENLNGYEIIAEDLGDLRKEVKELRTHYKMKGMNVLEFSLTTKEFTENTDPAMVSYTGTHDNQTLVSWFKDMPKNDIMKYNKFFKEKNIYGNKISDKMVNYCLSNVSLYAIIPIQDILGLDDLHRINTPGTFNKDNWSFKLEDYKLLDKKMKFFKAIVKRNNRAI